MKEIILDCQGILSRQQLHKALTEAFFFPDRYGQNLDSLHDMLTDIRMDTTLILENFHLEAPQNSGIRAVLEDSMAENPHLKILFVQPLQD